MAVTQNPFLVDLGTPRDAPSICAQAGTPNPPNGVFGREVGERRDATSPPSGTASDELPDAPHSPDAAPVVHGEADGAGGADDARAAQRAVRQQVGPALQPLAVDLAVPAEAVAALARGAERDAPDLPDTGHGAAQELALAGHAHDEDADRLGPRGRRDGRREHHLGDRGASSDLQAVRRAGDDGDVERAGLGDREAAPARLERPCLRRRGVGPEVDRRVEDGLEAGRQVVDGEHAATAGGPHEAELQPARRPRRHPLGIGAGDRGGRRGQRRLGGERDRLDVGVGAGRLVERDVLVATPEDGVAHGRRGVAEVGAQLAARRRPTSVVAAVQQRPRVRVRAGPGHAEVGERERVHRGVRPVEVLGRRRGHGSQGEAGRAADRVVAVDGLELQDAAAGAVRPHAPGERAVRAVGERRARRERRCPWPSS